MKKRIIAMLLCMIMLLTELPLTVLAQEYRQSKKLAEPASEQVTGAAGQQPEGEERTPAGDSAPAAEAMPSAEAQPKTDVSPFPEKQEDIVLNTEQGEIDYQQLWESQYPHGSFAFADYSGTIVEGATDGSDFLLIPLYRIGNTSGRATAYVTVTSPIYQNEDGTTNDSFALSFRRDATLEVEVANPIAYYQELAAPPLFAAEEDVTLELQDYVGETDFSGEADCPLTICPLLPDGSKLEAEHYAWQYRPVGSTWRTFADSDVQSLNVDYSQIFDENGIPTADYRMVFYRNDSVYCTPTLFTGDPYDPQEDLGQQIPQDLAPYEPLTFQRYEPEELYETVELELTFAGGEFVKYIRVRAKDDSEYSSNRMAILTVTETTGGQTCDIGPTYLITKQDDDLADRRPTQFVFETDETTTGSADNYAEVKVLRTGDTRYPATVKVSTEEGTAVEGEHYMRTEKEIAFAAGMTEATVSVPLLCEDSFSGEREFYLELTNSSDGDLASVGELNRTRVTISEDEMLTADRATDNGLTTNTLLQKNLNIQKVLAFSAGEEQYSKMKIGKSLLGESKEPVTLTVRSDAELVATAPKKLQSHAYEDKDKIRFKRTELKGEKSYEESADYWKDVEMPAGDSTEDGIYDVASLRDLIIPPTFKSNKTDMKKSIGNQAKEHFERNVTWPSLTPGGENRLSRGVIFSHNDKTTAPLKFTVPNVGAMYSHVYVDLSLPGSIGDVNRMGTMYSWVMPWVNINQKDDSSEDKPTEAEAYTNFNPVLHERQARIEEFYMAGTPEFVFERDVKLDEEKFTIRMGLTQNLREKFNNPGTGGSPTSGSITWQQISEMRLTRRVFKNTKSIGLIVHTANDENVNDQNPMNEMIYDDIRPRVELVKHESGINADGQLYVGSKLKVSMFNSGAFKPFKGQTAADSVFVTDQNGRILEVPVEQGADEDEYLVTMLWPGITQEDLDTNSYSINVVLERRQRVQIDIRPSLDREENGAVKTDETSIEEGWNRFLTTKDGQSTTITLTYAKRTVLEKPGDNAYQTCDCDEKNIFSPEMVVLTGDDRYQLIDPDQGGNGTCTFTDTALPGLKNIQSICFGLDHNDAIVMNGRLFHGNDTIMLESQDLSLELLNVIFYDSEYKGLDSVMNATIVKHQFYFDGNGNGRIDGYYNELSGLFILDEKSGDTLYCEDDGEIIDTLLAPEKNAEGKLCQYFMKTIYTMTPRALEADEEDEDKRAQVLPTLISAETQPGALSLLTEEQKSYRCLLASEADTQTFDFEKKTLGPKVNVKISSDEHIMYGAEATKQTFVDFPLGGNTHVYHELEPETIREFTGNLRVDFEDPECISWTDATGKDHIAENPND